MPALRVVAKLGKHGKKTLKQRFAAIQDVVQPFFGASSLPGSFLFWVGNFLLVCSHAAEYDIGISVYVVDVSSNGNSKVLCAG